MSSPIPPVAISDACSVILDNILYVYSPAAFQALPLQKGGNWTELENGVSVTGAQCVMGATNGTGEALYVVGGLANSSESTYTGLQKYSFADKSWETMSPITNVTQSLRNHSAVFLNDSSAILVYAGSQGDKVVASTQTFLISVLSPYDVRSYTAKNQPASSPILLPWSNDSAITFGGDSGNRNIYHFDPTNGWRDLNTSLVVDINSTQTVQGAIVRGSDNSKVLELYNLGVSPNEVLQYVLQEPNGTIAAAGTTIASTSSRKRKRDLTLADWPVYNATYASTTTRSGYSLAQGADGTVAFTGGDAQDPVELFNQDTNAWIDTTSFFGLSDSTATSSSTSSAATSSSTSTSTAAAAVTSNDHPRTSLILGATLGSILGFVALLILLLLCIRWRRRKRRGAPESEYGDEKNRLSFADRGVPSMKEAGGSVSHPTNFIDGTDASRRRSRTLNSQSSNANLVPANRASMGPNNAVEMGKFRNGVPSIVLEGNSQRNSTTSALQTNNRGSGWSGYFGGVSDLLKPAVLKNDRNSMASRSSSYGPSGLANESTANLTAVTADTYLDYSAMKPKEEDHSNHDCNTHGPTEIPPLHLVPVWDTQRVSQDISRATSTATSSLHPIALAPNVPFTSRGTHRRSVSSSHSGTDGSSNLDDTVFTRDENMDSNWTPVTKSDFNSSPAGPVNTGMRDTKSSSFYGDTTSPQVGNGAIMSPALRKSDFWGEPGPQEIFGEEEAAEGKTVGTPTPAPRARAGAVDSRKGEVVPGTAMSTPELNSDMSWLKIPGH